MAEIGKTRHERIIIGLIVVLIIVELLAWLRPQPYRWSEDVSMGTSVIELEGRYYLQTDAGALIDITEEYAEELRNSE